MIKKIAILAPEIHEPFVEGVQKTAWSVISALENLGVEPVIFSQFSYGNKIDGSKFKIFYFLSSFKIKIIKYLAWFFDSFRILYKIKAEKINEILVFSLDLPFWIPILLASVFGYKISVVVFSFRETAGLSGSFIKLIKNKVSFFHARSELMKKELMSLGVAGDQILVNLPFPNKSNFLSIDGSKKNKARFSVAYMSSSGPAGGVYDVLEVAEKLPNVDFYVAIRKFTDNEEKLFDILAETVNRGDFKNVYLVRNIDNIVEFLSQMDILVLPPKDRSSSMDIPMLLLEAAAIKLSVVASNLDMFVDFNNSYHCLTIFNNTKDLFEIIKSASELGVDKQKVDNGYNMVLNLPNAVGISEIYLK